MWEDQAALDSFAGVARIFPLPSLVLFPGIDQGLHIFEHRYRQMTADALASDQLITLVLLRPDWHDDYDAKPAIESVACLGRIVEHERMSDGRYNLHLRGLARLAVDSEIADDDKLYRLANGRIVPALGTGDWPGAIDHRGNLRDAVLARFAKDSPAHAQLTALFAGDSPLDTVCDQLGYCLPLPLPFKQQLLAEPDAGLRAELLVAALRPSGNSGRTFPPKFSSN